MEIPRKHDKKKNIKTLNVGVGSGGLGIGGVLLIGGALVTATIVSALAYKSRSQRRSSSENTRKNMSQSTETQSVGAPNKLGLVMKTDTDSSPSEEVVTSIKEILTESIQSLTPHKKHDEQVHCGDRNEDTVNSLVSKDQENASIRVDSASESEEQVVMGVQLEEDSCLKRDDGGEEQKHLMLTDNENEEHVDANSLVSDEGVVSIEEYETVEVPLKDIVSEDEIEHQETVVMNEAVGAMEVEDNLQVRFLAEKEKNDGHDEIILENCEGDLSDESGYADQIVHEVEEEKEAIDAVQNCARVQLLDGQDEIILENCERDLSNKKGPENEIMREGDQQMECSRKQVIIDHEVAPDVHEMLVNQVCETFVVECTMNRLKEAVDDQTAANEDTPPSRSINKEEKGEETAPKLKELVTVKDEAAKVNDQIPHAESVKQDEGNEEDVTVTAEQSPGVGSSFVQEEPTLEPKISNHKIEETDVQSKIEMTTDYELVKKDEVLDVEFVKEDEDSEEDVRVKAELTSGVSSSPVQAEPTPEPNISNHKIEENMDENQTILSKNHYDSEEDVTVKAELSYGDGSPFVQEQPTPETKFNNHKIQENMVENQTVLDKKHNDSDDSGVTKEQTYASEPWNLKLIAWSLLISVWCLCHWYSELPFPELSLVGSLFFILILFAYRNRATHLVKYE